MLDDKDIALLEAYTYGEISPEAETELRTRLAEDADFAAAVRRWELVEREGFVVEPAAATQAAVAAALARAADPQEEPKAGIPWLRYLLGLIVLGLLAYAGWTLLNRSDTAPADPPENTSTEVQEDGPYADLVQEYFRHLPSENFHLGTAETLEERALAAYEDLDYATALPLLLETVEMGGDSLNLLYAGVAALGVGDGELVVELATAVLANMTLEFHHEEARYIRVLGQIRNGKIDKASQLLEDDFEDTSLPFKKLKNRLDE